MSTTMISIEVFFLNLYVHVSLFNYIRKLSRPICCMKSDESCIFKCLYLHVSAWRRRTCVPLEACAPLGAGEYFVSVYVAGFEERIGTRLVPVQVEALDL